MYTRASLACLLTIATLLIVPGCSRSDEPRGILLLTLDTTRADRLGCYGYESARTPVLDELAANGARFAQAMTVVPVTLPAHASLFTGLYPPETGVRYNGAFTLGADHVTVAELLAENGWTTAGISAAVPLVASTGIGQGFQSYRDIDDAEQARLRQLRREVSGSASEATRSAEQITTLGLEWLRGYATRPEAPFFLWLHYFDPHAPYEPPFPFSSTFRDHPYDGEIAYMDREIGRLFDGIRDLGLWDDVDVVVVGDHGEGLYEHGEVSHGYLVFDSTLHVPLLIRRARGDEPRVIDEPVSIVDLAPTILSLAGLDPPATLRGTDLLPAVAGGAVEPRSLYFECMGGAVNFGWSTLEGLRRGPLKLVRSVSPELYDLEADPEESRNLYDADPPGRSSLEDELMEMLAGWAAEGDSGGSENTAPDAEQLARLESLGYLGADVRIASVPVGRDPRELIHLAGAVRQARSLMDSSPEEAAAALDRILAEDPTNRAALFDGARCALKRGDLERASLLADDLERYHPAHAETLAELRLGLSRAYLAAGNPDAARIQSDRAATLAHQD